MAGFGAGNGPYVIQMLNGAFDAFERGWNLVEATQATFEGALTALADKELPNFDSPPEYQSPNRVDITTQFGDVPEAPADPSIDYNAPTAPDSSNWQAQVTQALSAVDSRLAQLGDFVPSVTISPIAPPGAPNYGLEPSKPTVDSPTMPAAPTLAKPSLPTLTAINIPGSPALQLPAFSAIAPLFDIEPPQPVGEWLEPPYVSAMMSVLTSKLTDMLNGKSGLPDAAEQALFDRARSREDILALKQVQEITHAWSARGYSMPPGMLVAQVNAVSDENRLKASAVNRDVYIKAQETLIQQLNQAIEKTINLEQMLIGLHNSVQQRRHEMEKLRVEQAISIYNAMVQAFNIRTQAYATEANVYKTRVDAEMTRIEVFKAEIEAQRLVSEVNKQTLDVYRAQLEALKTDVDLYKASLDGVRAVVEIGTQKMQMYRSEIEAYVAKIGAERNKYEIYRTQVDAEIAKTNVIRAEADVYGTRMRHIEAVANISLKQVDGQLELARQNTALFVAEAEAERQRVASLTEVFRSQVAAYEAKLRKAVMEDERVVKSAEFDMKEYDVAWQNTIKEYELSMKKYDADMARMIEAAKIQQDSARAIAQYAAQIAAGAMSAVQMSIGATGSASSNESWQVSQNIT